MYDVRNFAQTGKEVSPDDVTDAFHALRGIFNLESLFTLIVLVFLAFVAGRLTAALLRFISKFFRDKADISKDLGVVNMFRRLETWIILGIAVFQVMFFMIAFYLWWLITKEDGNRSGALLGAGAVALVLIGGVSRPFLQDLASGASMMAENWFGVGDLITVEYPKAKGVVEMVSLRSTKIRGLNGETIWLANQSIQGVSVAHKGVLAVAIELFVNDVDAGEELVDEVNKLLPTGNALLAQKLEIVKVDQRDKKIWHITAVGETAPGRDWILSETAIELIKKLDENQDDPILLADPVSRFADRDTEKQFVRAVRNAKKPRRGFSYRRLTPLQIEKSKTAENISTTDKPKKTTKKSNTGKN